MKPRLENLMIYEALDCAALGGHKSPFFRASTLSWKAISRLGVS